MANTGFVKIQHQVFRNDAVTDALNAINNERFQGKLSIERDCHGNWLVDFNEGNFFLWKETQRTMAIHPPNADWMTWICTVVVNDLAVRFNGTISDEGVEETWPGVPGKYPTIDDYFYAWYDMPSIPPERKEEMLQQRRSFLPENFPECFRNRSLTFL